MPDVGPPGAGEVVIEVEASPIEPTDQYIIEGVYGQLPALPHCQGVGRVISLGRGVKHLREGDSMLVPLLSNARVERVKADASSLRPPPKGDVDQMSARDESGNRASAGDRVCSTKARRLDYPKWGQFRGRARHHPDSEDARPEDGQRRASSRIGR